MSKRGTSFRLESRHLEIIETRARQLRIGKSQYLRNLIDYDHKPIINSETRDMSIETKNARVSSFNEMTLTVIKALTREFDTTRNIKKPLNSIRGFAKKYDLKATEVEGILNQLVGNGILISRKLESGKQGYQWTYMGIVALPEHAPVDGDDRNLISGSAIGAISGMLGEYDDIVNYLGKILNIEQSNANSVLRFFLENYIGYFEWLREIIFPITGVNGELDHKYYRNQMIDYLLILILNSEKWKDWRTKEILDLKIIKKRILEHRMNKT